MSAAADRLAALDDYVSGHMPDDEAARFEEGLFAAADDDAVFVDEVARMVTVMAGSGLWEGGRKAHADALRAAGLNVHYVDIGSGGVVPFPMWPAGTQIVITRLALDVRGYDSVDVEVETADGRPIKTFRDASCDPTDGALYAVCQEPLARIAFSVRRTISKVVGVRGGRRETIATYDLRPQP